MQVLEQIEPQVAGLFALLKRFLEPRKNGKSYFIKSSGRREGNKSNIP